MAILSAVHARVPMVTGDENALARSERAERAAKHWATHRDNCQEQVALHQQLKAKVEARIERLSAEASRAQANVDAAQAALADPNQAVSRELTAREVHRLLREQAVSKQEAYRWRKRAELMKSSSG